MDEEFSSRNTIEHQLAIYLEEYLIGANIEHLYVSKPYGTLGIPNILPPKHHIQAVLGASCHQGHPMHYWQWPNNNALRQGLYLYSRTRGYSQKGIRRRAAVEEDGGGDGDF
jgi:hypothetical protein